MSSNRLSEFMVLGLQQIELLQVVYLKRSKILLFVALPKEFDKKIRKRRNGAVNKALHIINTSI